MLTTIRPSIPATWTVLVMADRGMDAHWLFGHIQASYWHPFLRSNAQGLYRPDDHAGWTPLTQVISTPGAAWSGQVTCFKGHPLHCTLIRDVISGVRDPGLIVTDLAPTVANVAWSPKGSPHADMN